MNKKFFIFVFIFAFTFIFINAKVLEVESLDNKDFISYKEMKLYEQYYPRSILFIDDLSVVVHTKQNDLYLLNINDFKKRLVIGNKKNSQSPGGYAYIISMFKDKEHFYIFDNMRNVNVFLINKKFKFVKRINLLNYTKGFPFAIDELGNFYCSLTRNKKYLIEKVNIKTKERLFIGKRDTLSNKEFFYHYSQVYFSLFDDKLYCLQSYFPFIEEYDTNGFFIKKYTDYSKKFIFSDLRISHRKNDFIEKITSSGFSNEWVTLLSDSLLLVSISYKIDSNGNHISLLHFYENSGNIVGYIEKNLMYLGSDNKNRLIFFNEENDSFVIGTIK